ncbi:GNAT family N-acetyltransferase [Novosphingobium terrae]|uniref:GNAT family N-acetyltransferase n=1 Tax=Novosphingobium terrae TaxID=2726189 RepID=UPI00197E6A23|nr:GNAT family N-acyltransferase [Novosphingobium terrae]
MAEPQTSLQSAPNTRGSRRLSVRLARDAHDLAAVQRLRWQVFFTEMGAHAAHDAPTPGLDSDAYDAVCDHLLVIDEGAPEDMQVVGTYRLLRESVARGAGGFYSAGEFDLTPLIASAQPGRELLELGRSCVLPAYRTSATIQLLWRGIADYIGQHSIGALFGCASFPGIDPDAHAEALSCLAHHHLAPVECRPVVKDGVALERLPRGSYDQRRALFLLPPLVKGYMRVGAQFGDGAYIDHAFNTVDVCVLMPVEAIAGRYATRFSVAA